MATATKTQPAAVVAFAEASIRLNEKGMPWRFARHQRRVLAHMFRRPVPLRVWSESKKSGKTFVSAIVALWWGFTHPNTEIIVVANDFEQAQGRVFKTIVDLCKVNPALTAEVTLRAAEVQVSNGTRIIAISSDYKSAAGSRHSLVVYDELWGFELERATRLYEELTPPPTEPDAFIWVSTYAGFTNESVLLEAIYQRGMAGERVDDELEIYEDDGLVMFWSETPRMSWQTPAYYAEQRKILRPNTFARLHENRWVSPESSFISAEAWDACVDPEHAPILLPARDVEVTVGVDAALTGDTAAIMCLARVDGAVVLVRHHVWVPSATAPIDLETTIEAALRQIHEHFRVARISCDPWQMARSIATLKAAGLPIEPYSQTSSNLTRAGQLLDDVIRTRALVLYSDDQLRKQALNATVIESPRGLRLSKPSSSRKIDAIAALSFACVAAVDAPARRPARLL